MDGRGGFWRRRRRRSYVTEPGTFYEKLHIYCIPVPRIHSQLDRNNGSFSFRGGVLKDVVPYASDEMPVCGAFVLEQHRGLVCHGGLPAT